MLVGFDHHCKRCLCLSFLLVQLQTIQSASLPRQRKFQSKAKFLLDVPGYLRHNSFQLILGAHGTYSAYATGPGTTNFQYIRSTQVQADSSCVEVEWASGGTNGLANVWQQVKKTWPEQGSARSGTGQLRSSQVQVENVGYPTRRSFTTCSRPAETPGDTKPLTATRPLTITQFRRGQVRIGADHSPVRT